MGSGLTGLVPPTLAPALAGACVVWITARIGFRGGLVGELSRPWNLNQSISDET